MSFGMIACKQNVEKKQNHFTLHGYGELHSLHKSRRYMLIHCRRWWN